MSNRIETPVGGTFNENNKHYQVEESRNKDCTGCSFRTLPCPDQRCSSVSRRDNKDVIFVEVPDKKETKKAQNIFVEVPPGFEIYYENDRLHDTLNIKIKKSSETVLVWDDLIEYHKKLAKGSAYIDMKSQIIPVLDGFWRDASLCKKSVYLNNTFAESALALAQISQLMPYYGGIVTDLEWVDPNVKKYVLQRNGNLILQYTVTTSNDNNIWSPVAFHTESQMKLFYNKNYSLLKKLFMMP